ncbi:MAG TPA: HEAT repeat domain-containing protein [Planctomycetota bacterium]|nr:HEAT repeat domain-containing protein [Planctomycetota bacterium]
MCWILPKYAFADRIGTPYRGPIELVGAGGQDNAGEPSGSGDTGTGDSGGGDGSGGGSDSGAPPPPDQGGGGAPGGGPGGRTAQLDGTVVWQWWWEYNKDAYLARASERGRVNMGSSYYWFGGGAKFPPRDIVPPSEKQRAAAAFTQLVKSLHADTSAGVRAEAAIGLGRVGVVAAAGEAKKEGESDNLVVRELILAVEKDTSPEVRMSAVLALGMTRDKDAAAYLLRSYEKHLATEKPYVLVALGLTGSIDAVKLLCEQVPDRGRSKEEIGVAAVHALGLLGPAALPEIEKAGCVAKMTKILDLRGHDALQAQLVRTLSLLQVARKDVAKMVDSPTQNIQWMSILSLANYTTDEKDAEQAFKTLEGKGAFGSGASQNKSFAVIAMGRLAGALDPNSKLRDKILKFIRKEALEPRKDNYVRSCAALAVGLAEDRSAIPTVAALLTDTTAQDHVVSAACVGLGLLRATEFADSIRDNVLLKKSWDDDTRGYAALGIALMGDTTRIEVLKHFAADKGLNDKTRRQLPLALGLLGDKGDVRELVDFFSKTWKKNERFETSNAAFGLAWLRDQSAVEQLVGLASKAPDEQVRGMAVIGLGYVAAQDRINPLARCYENASHRNEFGGFKLLAEISRIL